MPFLFCEEQYSLIFYKEMYCMTNLCYVTKAKIILKYNYTRNTVKPVYKGHSREHAL